MEGNSGLKYAPAFCWTVALLAMGLFGYLHGYGYWQARHWTWSGLDRWLYKERGRIWLRRGFGLPLLALGAGLLGWLLGWLARRASALPVFNTDAEQFPQDQRLRKNAYSLNLRTTFIFEGRRRRGWINLIEPFRGLLLMGSPGSGKSYFIVKPLIEQHLQKGFTLFVYDYKYDDLSKYAWNVFRQNADAFPVRPTFHLIHFDDLSRSARCNPLHPPTLTDLAEASEASRTLLLGLNRDWIRRQGDFFVESAINFLSAIIWFLRQHEGGRYCTLPHVIELMQAPYDQLFSILRTEPEIEFLINPFVSAYLQNVMPQLEGQIAGAKISLARLTSPHLYYILSGHDFQLDINNPEAPRIVCMGNNPRKQEVYGAVLSLYISRMVRLVNRPGGLPCSLVFDEFPTLYFNGMDALIATARSNKVATTLVVQDVSQLKKEYGREQAEVLLNITGNIISGQVSGESARQVSERAGRILQQRRSTHLGARDQSSSTSWHLDPALPPSRIATLSSGEMVGILSDAPGQGLAYKMFHGKVAAPKKGKFDVATLPLLEEVPTEEIVAKNYAKIKEETRELLQRCMARILNEPALRHLAVRR